MKWNSRWWQWQSSPGNLEICDQYCFFVEVGSVYSWASLVAQTAWELACNVGDPGLIPGLGILWRRKWLTTPVFLPGELHGQKNLAGYSPQNRKEMDKTLSMIPILLKTFWMTYTVAEIQSVSCPCSPPVWSSVTPWQSTRGENNQVSGPI